MVKYHFGILFQVWPDDSKSSDCLWYLTRLLNSDYVFYFNIFPIIINLSQGSCGGQCISSELLQNMLWVAVNRWDVSFMPPWFCYAVLLVRFVNVSLYIYKKRVLQIWSLGNYMSNLYTSLDFNKWDCRKSRRPRRIWFLGSVMKHMSFSVSYSVGPVSPLCSPMRLRKLCGKLYVMLFFKLPINKY